ncbi:hypothetical protein ACVWW5_007519 [Bradyrhizobium sp. LM3.4]
MRRAKSVVLPRQVASRKWLWLGSGVFVAIALVMVSVYAGFPRKKHTITAILSETGYFEVVPPSTFGGPGTINTIEYLSNGRLELHPTCDIDPTLLTGKIQRSRTVDRDLKQSLEKKLDVSAQVRDKLSAVAGMQQGRGGQPQARECQHSADFRRVADIDPERIAEGRMRGRDHPERFERRRRVPDAVRAGGRCRLRDQISQRDFDGGEGQADIRDRREARSGRTREGGRQGVRLSTVLRHKIVAKSDRPEVRDGRDQALYAEIVSRFYAFGGASGCTIS